MSEGGVGTLRASRCYVDTLMALFVTVRERRLWLWALAAAVAIYSTLGAMRPITIERPT